MCSSGEKAVFPVGREKIKNDAFAIDGLMKRESELAVRGNVFQMMQMKNGTISLNA